MNKWNVINNIFPTDEMRHSTEEENKLYSDMLERKSKTMEEYNKDNHRKMDTENKALEQLTSVAQDYRGGFITLNEFNYEIDCIIGDVLLESGYKDLYERFALLKENFSPYWRREGWVIPQ